MTVLVQSLRFLSTWLVWPSRFDVTILVPADQVSVTSLAQSARLDVTTLFSSTPFTFHVDFSSRCRILSIPYRPLLPVRVIACHLVSIVRIAYRSVRVPSDYSTRCPPIPLVSIRQLISGRVGPFDKSRRFLSGRFDFSFSYHVVSVRLFASLRQIDSCHIDAIDRSPLFHPVRQIGAVRFATVRPVQSFLFGFDFPLHVLSSRLDWAGRLSPFPCDISYRAASLRQIGSLRVLRHILSGPSLCIAS